MSYHAAHAAFEFEADLGQLRGLTRAGLAAHDYDLVRIERARDISAFDDDRQFFGISRMRQVRETPRAIGFGVAILQDGVAAVARMRFYSEPRAGRTRKRS